MFQPVNPKQSFPELENQILDFWQKEKIFEESVAQRRGQKKYVFFDGPPFANGLPHYGHILANALKDAVTRYWNMKGYYVPRVNGWDCHGLPVEYEIEKELGISGKKDIEKMGVAKFNEKCRESVFRYTKEWETLLKRLGRWVDFENSYATLDNTYMESIWWVFKQIWEKKMVYKGHKSMHICPRCETPLSNFEVSQGYKEVTDLSIYAKFRLLDDNQDSSDIPTYLVAWTTTPWTLPGNIAICLNPKITYAKVQSGNERYIVAQDLVEKVFNDLEYTIIGTIKAKDLEGKHYEPLFAFYREVGEKGFRVVLDDYVTTEEGTGLVHIAPMFGEDDYRIALKYELPLIQHVEMDGNFKPEVTPWAGKFVKGQEQNIVEWLKEKGLCFRAENYRHSYPHCWRCDTPLLNYSTRSWFIKVTEIKNALIKNNQKIHWQPPHIKEGRFGKWLEGARDWAISRNRFWGCPLPIWECKNEHTVCIESIDELQTRSKGKLPLRNGELDLHKPYIDDITFECECGETMHRTPEVLDCWFESGAMPYAQLHYPFENKEEFEQNFPAHFIAEGLDQTRGWFYTLHVLANILFQTQAFNNVIVNGILLAANGEKLSKRKKNYPDPAVLFETKGVDATRMFLYSSTAALAEDVRFSEKHVEEMVKKFSLTLWNTYSFFVTYATIDGWTPQEMIEDFQPSHKLDQWILSELYQVLEEVTAAMDDYNLTKATRPLLDFADALSNWYIRRSRRRFWKSENDSDKFEAYQTLYTVLVTMSQMMAPFMPFLSDAIYKNLTGEKSVHLTDWPKVEKRYINRELNQEHQIIRLIVTLGHAVRDKANIKVRQPLAIAKIGLPVAIDTSTVMAQADVICEELNVKQLEILADASEFVTRIALPNTRLLGPKYGKAVQEIIQKTKNGEFEIQEDGSVKVGDYTLSPDEVEIGFKGKEGFDVEGSNGVTVLIDTHITPDLRQEGYARDVIRQLQELRKEADYQVNDRIYIFIEVDKTSGRPETAAEIEDAIVNHADYIKRETLAMELQTHGNFEWDKEKVIDLEGSNVKVAVRK